GVRLSRHAADAVDPAAAERPDAAPAQAAEHGRINPRWLLRQYGREKWSSKHQRQHRHPRARGAALQRCGRRPEGLRHIRSSFHVCPQKMNLTANCTLRGSPAPMPGALLALRVLVIT